MPEINYNSDKQKLEYWRKYRPIIEDLNEKQLRQALVLLLEGLPFGWVIDVVVASYR